MSRCVVSLLSSVFFALAASWTSTLHSAEQLDAFADIAEESCVDCHGGAEAEARIAIDLMLQAPLGEHLADWRRVIRVLREGTMPPADYDQLEPEAREESAKSIEVVFRAAMHEAAQDPGKHELRRLTNAEYAYAIEDLTGVSLDIKRLLAPDSVGGSGFTNAASGQFMQDASLARYLVAAKTISRHAVVGTGPLYFAPEPDKIGQELASIRKIKSIYRKFGFRSAAGEGAEPYGLEQFPRAIQAAWTYQHGTPLGNPDSTLTECCLSLQVEPRFGKHIWDTLHSTDAKFPLTQVIESWNQLPNPNHRESAAREIKKASEALFAEIQALQERFAASASAEEEAALLSVNGLEVPSSVEFVARALRKRIMPDDEFTPDLDNEKLYSKDGRVRLRISIERASNLNDQVPVVIFRDPQFQFRVRDAVQPDPRPLVEVVSPTTRDSLRFGRNGSGEAIRPHEFVLSAGSSIELEIELPPQSRVGQLMLQAELDKQQSADCVVRCVIQDVTEQEPGRPYSSLIRDPDSQRMDQWERGISQFAMRLPQISHREPTPSDRDPIPDLFDNLYNSEQRNYFHTAVKYARDDHFLVEKILPSQVKFELDQAWTDLLMSFSYHQILYQFIQKKFHFEFEQSLAELDQELISTAPDASRDYLNEVQREFTEMSAANEMAVARHRQDLLAFAKLAWRRPLTPTEKDSLLTFARAAEQESGHEHSVKATIARILMSPAFLYKLEKDNTDGSLSSFELASRLSFTLWSSLPDAKLTQLANDGALVDKEQLHREVTRLMRSTKSERFAREFFGQWLGFYQFDEFRGVDPDAFPEFDERLRNSLYDQSTSFFAHLVRNDRPFYEMFFANYTFADPLVAEHLQLDTIDKQVVELSLDHQSQISLPADSQRAGLFGLGSVLIANSAPLRTSPVKRGDWILRRLIGTPVPPPPADAGSIPAEEVLSDGLTTRQRLEQHRTRAECMNCHVRIDPLGFTLENFDSLGRWRDTYQDGQPIDASGTLSDGSAIEGVQGLKEYLHDNLDAVRDTFSRRLVAYVLGRSESLADASLSMAVSKSLKHDPRLSSAFKTIVESPQFTRRRPHVSQDGVALSP